MPNRKEFFNQPIDVYVEEPAVINNEPADPNLCHSTLTGGMQIPFVTGGHYSTTDTVNTNATTGAPGAVYPAGFGGNNYAAISLANGTNNPVGGNMPLE